MLYELFPKDLGFSEWQEAIRQEALKHPGPQDDSHFIKKLQRHIEGKCSPRCRLCREAGLK